MRRVALVISAALAVVAGFTLTAAGSRPISHKYTVELDNAFGLTTGSDLKVAGVRAGTLRDIRLDRRTNDALVDVELTKEGFGDLRTDTFCESRPQSLIGEYYLDCQPGTDPKKLEDGATIPIEQTGSTVPADLLADTMRRPYRERFRIILGQLGVGLAARGDELNEAVRRLSPALRETDKVLAILADQNQTLGKLVKDGDTILGDLAGNRQDVLRWAREARGTAADSAERQQQISEGLNKLPGFLQELEPTMAELGRAVDAQTPSLRDLDASADRLEHLFTHLGPFARSSQLNLRSLGKASEIGQDAVKSARPVVAELNRFSVKTPELANNLDIVLHDLDNRDRSIEPNKRSPGGLGYTGFESLLQFVFDQSQAINIFDAYGYVLKANLFQSPCSNYQNPDTLKAAGTALLEQCKSWLGPSQQGVTSPDPTKPDGATFGSGARRSAKGRRDHRLDRPGDTAPIPVSATPVPAAGGGGDQPSAKEQPLVPLIDQAIGQLVPKTKTADAQDLLDFLLAP